MSPETRETVAEDTAAALGEQGIEHGPNAEPPGVDVH